MFLFCSFGRKFTINIIFQCIFGLAWVGFCFICVFILFYIRNQQRTNWVKCVAVMKSKIKNDNQTKIQRDVCAYMRWGEKLNTNRKTIIYYVFWPCGVSLSNKSHHVYISLCICDGIVTATGSVTHFGLLRCIFALDCSIFMYTISVAVPRLRCTAPIHSWIETDRRTHTHTHALCVAYAIFHFNFLENTAACRTCCFSSFTITHEISWARGKREVGDRQSASD